MFKFVVLSALLAAAAAEPGVFLAPNTYAATIPAPITTTYVQQSSTYLPASPVYSTLPYAHFIKKRSPQFYSSYVAPSTYIAGAPLATSYVASAPLAATYSSALLPTYAAPAHFIKKRSAALLASPATYIASAPIASTYLASAPLAATYSTAILPSASYYPAYSAGLPFIKK